MADLTPTQDLLVETLLARHRLGERLWTFDKRHTKALRELRAMGYVRVLYGIVENSVRAALTEEGIEKFGDPAYAATLTPKPERSILVIEGTKEEIVALRKDIMKSHPKRLKHMLWTENGRHWGGHSYSEVSQILESVMVAPS